jgi:hypothetical protein
LLCASDSPRCLISSVRSEESLSWRKHR